MIQHANNWDLVKVTPGEQSFFDQHDILATSDYKSILTEYANTKLKVQISPGYPVCKSIKEKMTPFYMIIKSKTLFLTK